MNKTKIVVFSGGTGGAKLTQGFSHLMEGEDLIIVANTGDDFNYCGLHISPDIDSIIYTQAAVINRKTGWGRNEESWVSFNELKQLDAASWFQLGDKDLAIHLYRTKRLREGADLELVTLELCSNFKVPRQVIPMSNQPVSTFVETDIGELAFQEYFVKEQCRPKIKSIKFYGSDEALPSSGFNDALHSSALQAVVFSPSNPYLSIDPILSIPAVRNLLREKKIMTVAVSPIVNGDSLKGPTAKIMGELSVPVNVLSIAEHYKDFINCLVIDERDVCYSAEIEQKGIKCLVTNIVMHTIDDSTRLAGEILQFVSDFN